MNTTDEKQLSRRETLTLLTSGALGLIGLSSFQQNKSSTGKQAVKMETSALKTIGILGGLGPQATIDLEMRLHKVAQHLISPAQNSGYPPMVVQYYRHAPVLLADEHTPVFPWQPDPRMLAIAKNLGVVADFILIPSNGVHLFQKDIEQASGKKVISMIEATLTEAKKRGWKKIGVLGFMNAKIYTMPLSQMGIATETVDEALQAKLNQSIFKVMEGREDDTDRAIAKEAIQQLRNKGVDGIIPGCTELPFLLEQDMTAPDIVNPSQLLAEAAVKFCIT